MKGAVWCYDLISGKEKLDEIKNNYIRCGFSIQKEVFNHSNSFIIFSNGDRWQLLKASENSQGQCLNISYIDHRINQEIINCIIKPTLKAMPYQAIHYF